MPHSQTQTQTLQASDAMQMLRVTSLGAAAIVMDAFSPDALSRQRLGVLFVMAGDPPPNLAGFIRIRRIVFIPQTTTLTRLSPGCGRCCSNADSCKLPPCSSSPEKKRPPSMITLTNFVKTAESDFESFLSAEATPVKPARDRSRHARGDD